MPLVGRMQASLRHFRIKDALEDDRFSVLSGSERAGQLQSDLLAVAEERRMIFGKSRFAPRKTGAMMCRPPTETKLTATW